MGMTVFHCGMLLKEGERRKYPRPNLSEHPLLMQAYELCREVDMLPPHPEQTELITSFVEWQGKLYAHLQRHIFLARRQT